MTGHHGDLVMVYVSGDLSLELENVQLVTVKE